MMPSDQPYHQQLVELRKQLEGHLRFEQVYRTLIDVSTAVSKTKELGELYKAIHQSLSTIVDTSNFYIALHYPDTDKLVFPYFVDQHGDTYPTISNISKTSSLSAEVIRTGTPLLIKRKQMVEMRARNKFMPPACSLSEIWLGVPLKAQDKIIGVMAVQSYTDPDRYHQSDMDILMSVAGQVATAIEYKRAEESRRESEERYSAVVKQASEGIYLLDPKTKKVLEANRAFLSMIGRTESEIAGLYVYDFVWHDKVEVDNVIALAISQQEHSPHHSYLVGERKYLRRDGSILAVEPSVSLIKHGGTSTLCVIVRDITERKKTEAALRESEQKYRRLVENATDAIYQLRPDGSLVNINQAACELLGYSREEFLELNVTDIDANLTTEKFRKFIEELQDETPAIIESLHRRKDGTLIPVEINTVSYHQNHERFVIGLARDITDRKRAEKELLASSARIRAFFSSINDAIFVHPLVSDGFAPIIEVNEAACVRYGYSRDEFLHMTMDAITKRDPNEGPGGFDHWKNLQGKSQMVFEAVHIRKNGDTFPVEINSNIVIQHDNPVILSVVRDISERRLVQSEREHLRAQLQQAQKLESIGRLAGGIAHDFNNMLSVIIGRAELALETISPDHHLYEDLCEIRLAAEHSSDLTRQLLTFARKQPITPVVFDLNKAISDTVTVLERLIGEDITLRLNTGKELCLVKMDPVQLNQILTNLCVNARDAISGPGSIVISTSTIPATGIPGAAGMKVESAEYAMITVTDNGRGIPPENVPQLFEPFFTTKDLGKGTGLGLATVYGVVRQNQGFIEVTSTPGIGTSFVIYLPTHRDEPAVVEVCQTGLAARSGQENILIVEDEPAILAMCKSMLEKQGYRVLVAQSPMEALYLAKQSEERIDLLLSDVVMPEMNGRELADRLHEIYPDMKNLFMSGYATSTLANQGILSDSVHFIQKPFSSNSLTQRIRSLLESSRLTASL